MKRLLLVLIGLLAVFSLSYSQDLDAELKEADEAFTEIMKHVRIYNELDKDTIPGFVRISPFVGERKTSTGRYIASLIPEGIYATLSSSETIVLKMTVKVMENVAGKPTFLTYLYVAKVVDAKIKHS